MCGITRPQDAERAALLGVDALGLVFAARSPRRIDPAAAREIRAATPPFVTLVALLMDQPQDEVQALLDRLEVDVLQFHGNEPEDLCRSFGKPYIKAIPMGEAAAPRAGAEAVLGEGAYPSAAAWLFDAHAPGEPGGRGRPFDWTRVPRRALRPVILAGGLTPGNVAAAVRAIRPYAVDVSSGVESHPGIKDHDLMRRFVEEVRYGDRG